MATHRTNLALSQPVPLEFEAGADVILTTPEGYEAFLSKLYQGLAHSGQNGPAGAGDIRTGDEGFSQYMRGLWNAEEMPTDEAENETSNLRFEG